MTSTQSRTDSGKEVSSSGTKGSCLCGAVQFSITGSPLMRLLCHCISCKKISGSLLQANNFYRTSQLIISPLTAQTAIQTYIDKSPQSQRTVHRSFCAECGSRLWNTMPDEFPDNVAIMAGVLDFSDDEWKSWTPEREFFCKRKGDWMSGVGASEEGRSAEM